MGLLALAQVSQEELKHEILHTWETAKHTWEIPIHLGPIDISIDKSVWFLFIGTAITFLLLFIGSRILSNRPGAYQVIVEELYGFGRSLGGQVGEEGKKWFPYTLSLFVFILVLNLIGLIPYSYPVTSNISFTITLALLTFALTQFEGFRRNGVGGYAKSFVPSGLPAKPIMVPLMMFLEILQEFTKPLTLALRLYANILAGHLIIFVFLGLILFFGLSGVGLAVPLISVPLAVGFYAFEIFVAILQAYIFAILTQVYIEMAMFREDH